ncbi:MAG: AMP-binding protein, partial [Syntrophaceae bacterium]|nr:AMP-binding protein [Syntrophaceae bacterium]
MSGFVNKTIGQIIRETAKRHPLNPALVHPDFGVRLNYQEFYNQCRKVAKGLMALGVKRGDHVSVWTTNIPEWIYLQFGLGMVGGVLVTVNTNYQSHELEYILKQSDSSILFVMEAYRDVNFYETVRRVIPELDQSRAGNLVCEKLPLLKKVIYIGNREIIPGMLRFEEMLELGETISDAELEERIKTLDANDVINMQYTSGTTGFPKGVMLTHRNIVNNGRMVGDVMGMTEKDKLLIQVPLFHCFGCVMSTMNAVYHASTMVVMEFFDPLKALAAINSERCTAINGV